MIGQTVGHYRIKAKLGEGGMGVVYEAQDTHLDRPVAIKVLPPERVADLERKRRFVQEAKAASALNHPNIVHIYDIDTASGVDFIAMEYVVGTTLHDLIARQGLKAGDTLKCAVQIADALTAAHAAGIVHRDIKPSNVMVTEKGLVKILDFGLAKLAEQPVENTSAATQTMGPLTEEGVIIGTAAYMSPEQAEGRKLDSRSDIFSFGCVLYEMMTARRPFIGDSRLSILSKILNEDPTPPSRLSPSIPPELEKIMLRCLRKDPARRYQTMADLKVALEDVASESGSEKQVRRVPLWPRWAWAALLPVLLVVGFFVWRAGRAPESALRAIPLNSLPGVQRYPSFSPDGNYVAVTWNGPKQDNPDIYVQQIGSSGSPLRLTTDPANDYNPVWSPDGRWIAFLRSQSEAGRSELRLIPPLGGPEHKLAEIRVRSGTFLTPPYLTWCPQSNCLVVTDSPEEGQPDALFVIALDTGEKRQLTHPQRPAGDTNPAISPDGCWLVFRRMVVLFSGELYRLALGRGLTPAGEPQRLPVDRQAESPAWMPDSREILYSVQGSLWRLIVPGENQPRRLPFVGQDGMMPVVSHPQPGRPLRLAYVHSFQDFNIWRLETTALGAPASSPPVVSPISSTRGDWHPQLSPDGRRVAFSSDRAGEAGIWLADPDGSNAIQLASMGISATGAPQWSPDGNRIAFHSNLAGHGDVYVIPIAGGKPRNLTSHPGNNFVPSFSHDGHWIYFTSNRAGEYQIWKIPVSGGDAVQVTKNVGYRAVESPDGAWLYYVETMDKPSPLWRVPVSGGDPVKVLDGIVMCNFAVLDKGIYYIDRPSGGGGVYYLDKPSGQTRLQYFSFATRRSTIVARDLGNVDYFVLTVSRDGRTILYSRVDSSVDDLMLVENFR